MKWIFTLFLFFIFLIDANAYMSKEEVLKQIQQMRAAKSLAPESLSASAKWRELSLVPDKDFLKDLPKLDKELKNLSATATIKDMVDLRNRDTSVKSQDNGKCSAFAGVAVIENMMNKEKVIPGLDLSEWNAWSLYRQYSCEAFISALSSKRIGDEKDYPQYGKADKNLKPYAMISKQIYIDNDIASMVDNLNKGNPIYLAMKTPKSMLNCDKVINSRSSAASGGHALAIVGYYPDGNNLPIAIIKNSWGADCGDQGYQYMSMSICKQKGFYCYMWAIQEVSALIDPPAPKVKKVCSRSWRNFFKLVCVDVPITE